MHTCTPTSFILIQIHTDLKHNAREDNGTPLQYSCLENPWTEEPGGLLSMGSHRVEHDWSDLAAAAAAAVTGLLWPWAGCLPGTGQGLTVGMILSQSLHLYSEVVALDNFWAFAGKFYGRSSLFIKCTAGSLDHLANFIAWLLPLEWSFKERVGVNLQFQLYIESFRFRGYLLQSLILQRSELNTLKIYWAGYSKVLEAVIAFYVIPSMINLFPLLLSYFPSLSIFPLPASSPSFLLPSLPSFLFA